MSLTYTSYVSTLAGMLVIPVTDTDFQAQLPNFIDSAELRIYRDVDILDTVVRDTSAATIANSRDFTLPSFAGRFVVVNGVNIITPSGSALTTGGSRKQLYATSRDYIDAVWPSEVAQENNTAPQCFAMLTSQRVIFGPPPGAIFNVEVVGTIRPTPLSVSNPTTVLSLYYADLFLAASMIFGAAYQKNFSASADDPRAASSWTTHYQSLLQQTNLEEFRKKFAASAWSSLPQSPTAQPPRN